MTFASLQLKRGRYVVMIWSPVVIDVQRDLDAENAGWHGRYVGIAWGWRFAGRWKWPREPRDGMPTLLQGFRFGPLDLRRVAPDNRHPVAGHYARNP